MKRWFSIIGLIVIGLLLTMAVGGTLWFHLTVRRSLPKTSGEISLGGLNERVEIIRDLYGIPHIYAKNEPDLYFALGYAMAQDRLWQMDFYRRLGHGQLSEVLGEDLIEVDRFFRIISAAGMNKTIPKEIHPLIKSFSDGINTFIENQSNRLPFEFKLLNYRPNPWSPEDYLAILKVISWGLSNGWRTDLTAAKILDKVGEKKWREAFPLWPEDAPIIIPEETRFPSKSFPSFSKTIALLETIAGLSTPGASNSWVVSGKRSTTGKPLLANDPHLGLTNPSIWWEVHMVCPTMNVFGFALPGVPGVAIGHNLHVAWGVTNVMVDDVDFYIEKINPENPRQYWVKDHWEEMRVREETIRVKGREPIKIEILLTRHGPVINNPKESMGKTLSARWSFTEGGSPAQAAYLLAKAKNLQDVKGALKYWDLPCQNLVFADVDGNIGYWCCAMIPIRLKGEGLLPSPGWTDEYEWKGYVPFEKRPHRINPKEGFIATANNKVVSDHFPYFISHYWEPIDRITRIHQWLNSKERFSIEDFRQMQQDVYSMLASELVKKIVQVLDHRFKDEKGKKAKEIFSRWDFNMDQESVAACMFEVTYRKMIDNIFKGELGEELFLEYLKTSTFPPSALRMMIRKGSSSWFGQRTLEDIIEMSLKQMFSELKEKVGSNMNRWKWGRIHSLTFEHPLGKKKPLSWILNLGPFPVGGNHLTMNMRYYLYEKPYHTKHGVSERMIVDLSNMEKAFHVLPTGESGHIGSPHHKDQISLYLKGQYHPGWMGRREIERNGEAILILKPKLNS